MNCFIEFNSFENLKYLQTIANMITQMNIVDALMDETWLRERAQIILKLKW